MGTSFEFYAGDPEKIGEAVRKLDFDTLNDPSHFRVKADLSLHLEPRDLDTLSKEVAAVLGRSPVLLRESFDRIICDEPDHGAMLINRKWVAQFAAIPVNSSNNITEKWIRTMAKLYKDSDIHVTEEARAGVAALIQLCHYAHEHSTPVVHVWYL